MSEAVQTNEKPATEGLSLGAATDPMLLFRQMSERMGLGPLPSLLNALAGLQRETLCIAVHAPFVPFHIYAEAIEIRTPAVAMMESAEEAATQVAETMSHNAEVLQQEGAHAVEEPVEAVAEPVKEAPPQKSASPRAKTASGPSAGSGT